MKNNEFVEFFKNNLGFLIGLIIGALIVLLRFTYFFINLAFIILFGFLGRYVQKNKNKVKETLKNLIDKI